MFSLLVVMLLFVSALIAMIALSMVVFGLFFFKRFARVLLRKGNSNV